ncbi:hypothetical protein NSZ01_24290 [Nocardioides szechwanensis]|uniref:Lipoprotein n=2 Tax=Nocardioides szechwanensis TaxID=1005944 RepID=A0A1H0EII1_9ACTN|nr:hypothetical protein NSZ01_24290 [Nocardioides szechwanensis]SDN82274.1 hypothetical protein SAMN05192576_2872 [Nocardioides szechwanensis]
MRTPVIAASSLALALSLAACSDEPDDTRAVDPGGTSTSSGPAFEVAASGGCGEAFFWAADADGSQVIQVYVEQRDRSAAQPTALELTLPDPEVTATLQTGTDLIGDQCNDILNGRVSGEQAIVEGSGTMTLGPPSIDGFNGVTGTLTMTGLVAADGTLLPDLTVTTDMIGFYAG